jgi:hypothetical protein
MAIDAERDSFHEDNKHDHEKGPEQTTMITIQPCCKTRYTKLDTDFRRNPRTKTLQTHAHHTRALVHKYPPHNNYNTIYPVLGYALRNCYSISQFYITDHS